MTIKRISIILLCVFSPIILMFLIYIWATKDFGYSSSAEVWKGQFKRGFEMDAFRPCGEETWWWTTGNLEGIDSVISRPYGITNEVKTVYIEFTGEVSTEGNYGHLGAYNREIKIKDVYTIQEEIPSDCH